MRRALSILSLTAACAGCSTLADSGGGDANLPNAGVGPFREIDNEELGQGRAAPYAFRDDEDFPRDAAIIDADGDFETLEKWAYVAKTVFAEDEEPDRTAPPNEIVRHVAVDGRSFARQFDSVLTTEEDWEMDTVGSPAAVRFDGRVLLFYAAAGGIGVAVSEDGRTFERPTTDPVLGPSAGWEDMVAPTSPGVVALPDGTLRMYYAVPLASGSAIGIARSSDGLAWERVGDGPTLAPREGEIDAGGVGAPFVILGRSTIGRDLELLYHAATDGDGRRTIALAARFGTDGPWSYATAPVFGSAGSLQPTEPVVVPFPGYSLLFVTEKAGTTEAQDYAAVAIGVAPADADLPPPDEP